MDDKKKLLREINDLGQVFSSTTLRFHQYVAESLGLASADHKYLGILVEKGAMTAGELAYHSGLTTGAVTGVIDRLEKKKLISREKDPDDRRKVVIVPNQEIVMQQLGPIFQRLAEKLEDNNKQFSAEQLQTIKLYMETTIEQVLALIPGKSAGAE